jgi:hypothetical protein
MSIEEGWADARTRDERKIILVGVYCRESAIEVLGYALPRIRPLLGLLIGAASHDLVLLPIFVQLP